MNKAVINICEQVLCEYVSYFLLSKYLEVGLLSHTVIVCLTFQ